MPASLTIHEEQKDLTFQVSVPRSMTKVWLTIVFGCIVTALVWRFSKGLPSFRYAIFAVCLYQFVRGVIAEMRGTKVLLRVNNLDLVTMGSCREGYSSGKIARADVVHMEYRRSQSGGGEGPTLPEGLYVEFLGSLWNGSRCMLPGVNESQTRQVVEVIYRRFPDTGSLIPASEASKSHIITLNLVDR